MKEKQPTPPWLWFVVKKVATDMVMVNVSFYICEIATKDIEGSTIVLQVASYIHETTTSS